MNQKPGDPSLQEFYKYFQDLKEYVDLSNLVSKKDVLLVQEEEKVKKRVNELSLAMKKFRERVYQKIQRIPDVTKKVGSKATYHCTNRKCRHKFEAIRHPFLKVLYNCPKCRASTLEII